MANFTGMVTPGTQQYWSGNNWVHTLNRVAYESKQLAGGGHKVSWSGAGKPNGQAYGSVVRIWHRGRACQHNSGPADWTGNKKLMEPRQGLHNPGPDPAGAEQNLFSGQEERVRAGTGPKCSARKTCPGVCTNKLT